MVKDLLTVLETSRLLHKSPDSVRYYERQGRLKAQRIGTHRVFSRKDVERFKRLLEMEAEENAKTVAEEVHA
jgi:DNA-binding transcriptional MerR regulator